MLRLKLNDNALPLKDLASFAFERDRIVEVQLSAELKTRVMQSHRHLLNLIEKRIPIYGVTTGFGDSCQRFVTPEQSTELQKNLIAYLSCGSGPLLPIEASRATFLVHLKSLSRGYSGVSVDLLDRMALYLEKDWIPAIPREGSLGASGDLIPLAYIARAIQGEGDLHVPGGTLSSTSNILAQAGVSPYTLKPKEGLALVNGTSAMCGLSLVNWINARFLTRLSAFASFWQCLALQGRVEAFGSLVNEKAKIHTGQARVASWIRANLESEGYQPLPGQSVSIGKDRMTEGLIQDRYSLRCVPQILGPIEETLDQIALWIEREANSTADNPLIDNDGSLGMGGNFYGGYLSHSMDYLKICLANQADLVDRQLLMLVDEKSNRGLPSNLSGNHQESELHLHHGLKGLHQATSAITSEIIQRSFPASVLSRSTESHNQDKVSLGMSAAAQAFDMIEPLFTIQSMQLIALAQALDLRGITLKGTRSHNLYRIVRNHVPFVSKDRPLGDEVKKLSVALKTLAAKNLEDPFE